MKNKKCYNKLKNVSCVAFKHEFHSTITRDQLCVYACVQKQQEACMDQHISLTLESFRIWTHWSKHVEIS